MADGICFFGLDVHARKTAGAAVVLGSGRCSRLRSWRADRGDRVVADSAWPGSGCP